jgi:hypothetical protein
MTKNQIAQGAQSSVFSIRNRHPFWGRFFLLALLLTLTLTSLQPKSSAHNANPSTPQSKMNITNIQSKTDNPPSCHDCQRALVECLAGGGTGCYSQYNACIENCE